MNQLASSSSSFRMPEPETPRPSHWPAYAMISAIVATSVIALNPAAGAIWSEWTYPAVAAVDQRLQPWGVALGPEPMDCSLPQEPVLAVVLGQICEDEDAPPESPQNVKAMAPIPQILPVQPTSFHSHFSPFASEADELPH